MNWIEAVVHETACPSRQSSESIFTPGTQVKERSTTTHDQTGLQPGELRRYGVVLRIGWGLITKET
jgi:hypothetical protein